MEEWRKIRERERRVSEIHEGKGGGNGREGRKK